MKRDPEYVDAINSLIPIAEREARGSVNLLGIKSEGRMGFGGNYYNHCFFTQFFHEIMKKLAIEKELRSF